MRGKGLLGEIQGSFPPALRGKLGWMTPRIRCENGTGNETCFRGSRSQAGAHFFSNSPGMLTTGHKTTVILQDWLPERLPFRAERSVRNLLLALSVSRSRRNCRNCRINSARHTYLNSTSSAPRSSPDPTRAAPASPATAKRHTQTTIPFSRR